jgi:hypothetical protein
MRTQNMSVIVVGETRFSNAPLGAGLSHVGHTGPALVYYAALWLKGNDCLDGAPLHLVYRVCVLCWTMRP